MTATTSPHAVLRAYPDSTRRLVEDTRRCVRRWLPDAVESVDVSARVISYGYGPGYKGMVCTLILGKTGIKLGLVGGATLSDPHGLLAGKGKVHRHVQLSKPRDLQQAGLKQLVLAASAACRLRLNSDRPVRR